MTKFRPKNTATVAVISKEQLHTDDSLKTAEKESFTKEADVAYSLRPIIYLSRVFGFMCFSMRRGTNGEIGKPKVTKWDALWFIISLGIHTSLTYLVHIMRPQFTETPTFVLRMGDHLLLLIEFVFGIVILIIDLCNRFKTAIIFKRFIIFDSEVTISNLIHSTQ